MDAFSEKQTQIPDCVKAIAVLFVTPPMRTQLAAATIPILSDVGQFNVYILIIFSVGLTQTFPASVLARLYRDEL